MFVLLSNDDVLKMWASNNLVFVQRGGGARQVGAGLHTCSSRSNVTRLESMTPLPSGGFALCDKSSRNVNKLSDSANLLSYLRTATEEDLPPWQVFVSSQKSAKSGGGKFRADARLNDTRDASPKRKKKINLASTFIFLLGLVWHWEGRTGLVVQKTALDHLNCGSCS